jgi:hypothetical protein
LLSEKDTSPALSISIKEGKYMLYQKLHATQQQQINNAAEQSEQSEQSDDSNPTDLNQSSGGLSSSTKPAPQKPATTILTLPTEIRLMIYGYAFNALTENAIDRTNTYPLPPFLRTNSVFRNESLQEWGSHLERVVAKHKEVQERNVAEKKELVQRGRDFLRLRSGNMIKLAALKAANEGQCKVLVKRVDKLRLLQAHQMLAESGESLSAGGSDNRWRDGRV